MSNDTKPTPIELLREISPGGAKIYMEHRAAIMDDPRFQALPLKIKLLIGIAMGPSGERC
jgi:hypothetical protein